jgi:hypothetical protein
MQTSSSETLIGWRSGKTTYVPLWDRMEGAWLWTLDTVAKHMVLIGSVWYTIRVIGGGRGGQTGPIHVHK